MRLENIEFIVKRYTQSHFSLGVVKKDLEYLGYCAKIITLAEYDKNVFTMFRDQKSYPYYRVRSDRTMTLDPIQRYIFLHNGDEYYIRLYILGFTRAMYEYQTGEQAPDAGGEYDVEKLNLCYTPFSIEGIDNHELLQVFIKE